MKFIRGNRNKRGIGTLLFLLSFLFSLQALPAKVEDSITTSGVLFQDEVWSGQVHVTEEDYLAYASLDNHYYLSYNIIP